VPDLKIPPHPTHDYSCKKCRFWLKETEQTVAYIQSNGGVSMAPVSEMIKQGQSIEGLMTARIAACTKFPKWETCPQQHWCHQFESVPNGRGEHLTTPVSADEFGNAFAKIKSPPSG
jgi:hypothetical protein